MLDLAKNLKIFGIFYISWMLLYKNQNISTNSALGIRIIPLSQLFLSNFLLIDALRYKITTCSSGYLFLFFLNLFTNSFNFLSVSNPLLT